MDHEAYRAQRKHQPGHKAGRGSTVAVESMNKPPRSVSTCSTIRTSEAVWPETGQQITSEAATDSGRLSVTRVTRLARVLAIHHFVPPFRPQRSDGLPLGRAGNHVVPAAIGAVRRGPREILRDRVGTSGAGRWCRGVHRRSPGRGSPGYGSVWRGAPRSASSTYSPTVCAPGCGAWAGPGGTWGGTAGGCSAPGTPGPLGRAGSRRPDQPDRATGSRATGSRATGRCQTGHGRWRRATSPTDRTRGCPRLRYGRRRRRPGARRRPGGRVRSLPHMPSSTLRCWGSRYRSARPGEREPNNPGGCDGPSADRAGRAGCARTPWRPEVHRRAPPSRAIGRRWADITGREPPPGRGTPRGPDAEPGPRR
jgi:hypothetical protein